MKDLKTANKCLRRLIKSQAALDDGIYDIIDDMRRVFHFSDVARFNRQTITECYGQFEEWLNNLVVSEPMPAGILALYFGLADRKDGVELCLTGSRQWSLKDPSWITHHDWYPEGRCVRLPVYADLSRVLAGGNPVGYYLSIAILAIILREYSQSSMISLLDSGRQSLCIACGFEGGELHAIGDLYEDGLEPPVYSGLMRLLG